MKPKQTQTPKPAILASAGGSWELSIAEQQIDLYKVKPNIEWYQKLGISNLYIIPANPNLDDEGDPSLEKLRDYIFDEFLLSIDPDGDEADISDYFPDKFDMVAQWMAIQGQETFNWFAKEITKNLWFQQVNEAREEIDGVLITLEPEDWDEYYKESVKAQVIYELYVDTTF